MEAADTSVQTDTPKTTSPRVAVGALAAFFMLFTAEPAHPQNPLEQGAQQLGSGVKSLFEALGSILNPKAAEVKDLHKSGNLEEARARLQAYQLDLSPSDLTELKELLKPSLEAHYQEAFVQEIERLQITSDVDNLLGSAEKLNALHLQATQLNNELLFFDIPKTTALSEKTDAWITKLTEHLRSAQNFDLLMETLGPSAAARSISKIAAEPLRQACTDVFLERESATLIKTCESLLPEPVANQMKRDITDHRLKVISTNTEKQGTYEYLKRLLELAEKVNLSPIDWRNKIEPLLPELKVVPTNSLAASKKLTHQKNKILITSVRTDIQQHVKRSTKQGRFVSGTETTPNSDYLTLQRQYQQAVIERQNCNQQFAIASLTNPYAINLCWLLNSRISQLDASLITTSPTTTNSTYSDYSYEVSEVTVSLQQTDLAVIDSTSTKEGAVFFAFPAKRTKTFSIARGLHPKDERHASSDFNTEADITKFMNSPQDVDTQELYQRFSTETPTSSRTIMALLSKNPVDDRSPKQSPDDTVQSEAGAPTRYDRVMSRSIVVVHARDGLGTGFYVRGKIVLTNQHVTAGQSLVQIENRDGEKITGMVLAEDEALDLAIIALSKTGEPLRLSKRTPKLGDEAIAFGHPRGNKFSLTKGIVSAVRKIAPVAGSSVAYTYIQTDVPINPGNSGGPLMVGDQVIGVNTFKAVGNNTEGLGFALSSDVVEEWLRRNAPPN